MRTVQSKAQSSTRLVETTYLYYILPHKQGHSARWTFLIGSLAQSVMNEIKCIWRTDQDHVINQRHSDLREDVSKYDVISFVSKNSAFCSIRSYSCKRCNHELYVYLKKMSEPKTGGCVVDSVFEGQTNALFGHSTENIQDDSISDIS